MKKLHKCFRNGCNNFTENRKYCSYSCNGKVNGHIGGTIGGKLGWKKADETNRRNKTGIYGISKIQHIKTANKSIETNRRNKTGFFNKENMKDAHIKAINTQKINKVGFFNSEIRSKGGKIGGRKAAITNKKNKSGAYYNKLIRDKTLEKCRKDRTGIFSMASRKKALFTNMTNKVGIFNEEVKKNRIIKQKEEKTGFWSLTEEQRSLYSSLGGKISSLSQRENKTGIYSISKEDRIKNGREARKYQIMPVKDTTIEIKIQNYLKQLGIEFLTHQYIKDIEHGYQCDILIPLQLSIKQKTIIECDGNYWHNYPIGNEKDIIRTKELTEKGWRVIRLWEHEIKKMSVEDLRNKFFEIEDAS